MSAYISGAVWLSGPKQQTRRFVLLAIADNANDEGFAWPSIQSIAEKCLMTTRTVISCISDLESEGWVIVNRKAVEAKGNSYQIVLDKLTFKRPKSREKISRESGETVSRENPSQVKLATDSRETDDIVIRKNRQEPSYSLEASSSDFALTAEIPSNGNGRPKESKTADPRHSQFKAMIEAAYSKANGIQCPWTEAEGAQLKRTISACPSLDNPTFKKLLLNYFNSEDHPRGDRPSKFLPRIFSYTTVLTKFKTEETNPDACRFE